MRTHAFTLVLSYIYGLVALLDNTQSSFSSITISTPHTFIVTYNWLYLLTSWRNNNYTVLHVIA